MSAASDFGLGLAAPASPALWRNIFGNDRPVEIEIGPGTGAFLLSVAPVHPERNYLAIEHSRSRTVRLEGLVAARRLPNVRLLHADAACVVRRFVPPASVAAYHIYFPDPWWKRRHHRRRLFTADLAGALARTLAPGGRLYLATDVPDVFALMRATIASTRAFTELAGERSPRTTVTSFERKGLARGATIHEAVFVRRPELVA